MYIPLSLLIILGSWLWYREWDTPDARKDRQRVRAVWKTIHAQSTAAYRDTRTHWRAVQRLAMGLAWEQGVSTWLHCGLSVGWHTLKTVNPHNTYAMYRCQIPLYEAWIVQFLEGARDQDQEKALARSSVAEPARRGK
jgi:hypothetical protein